MKPNVLDSAAVRYFAAVLTFGSCPPQDPIRTDESLTVSWAPKPPCQDRQKMSLGVSQKRRRRTVCISD
jgi:hypothetical protein